MLKRKAEGPPEFEVETTSTVSEIEPTAEPTAKVQGPVAGSPTGGEYREVAPVSHLSPVADVPATEQVSDDQTFWDLLALFGYETW